MTLFVPPARHQFLKPRVYAAFGFTDTDAPNTWVWTDITKYVRGVANLSGGLQALDQDATPQQITFSLDNTDGRFTARNPASPYYPGVIRNVPLKVAVTWFGAVDEYELGVAFVNGWPVQPQDGLEVVWTPMVATGRLRRLRTTATVLDSPLRAAIGAAANLKEYCPMEDTATIFAAVIGKPGHPTGRTQLASSTAIAGSKPLADFSKGGVANFPATTNSTFWTAQIAMAVGSDPGSTTGIIDVLQVTNNLGDTYTASMDLTNTRWQLKHIASGVTTTGTSNWNGIGAGMNSPFDSNAHIIQITTSASGPVKLYVDDNNIITISPTTLGSPATAAVGSIFTTDFPYTLGHFTMFASSTPVTGLYSPANGWVGEQAVVRAARVAAQAGIPLTVLAGFEPSPTMGPQPVPATLLAVLDECKSIDNAMLHDAGNSGALVYIAGSYLYNQVTGVVAVPSQLNDDLTVQYDDQDLVNQWTISRPGGLSATVTSPSAGTDIVAQSETVNAESDAQLDDIAGWRVHLGTNDTYRIPLVTLDLRRNPELALPILGLLAPARIPARVSPITLPLPFPPGQLDQFVIGYNTTLSSEIWQVEANCTPAQPWSVGIWGESKYGSATSTLNTTLPNTTGTTVSVAVANPLDLWTLDSTQWTDTQNGPLFIRIGDEIMKVTNITGATSPQSMTVVRGVGVNMNTSLTFSDSFNRVLSSSWGNDELTGTAWVNTSGGPASDFSCNAGRGKHTFSTVSQAHVSTMASPMSPGNDYDQYASFNTSAIALGASQLVAVVARAVDDNNHYQLRAELRTDQQIELTIRIRNSGVETQLATAGLIPGLTHGALTLFRMRFRTIGERLMGKIWLASAQEPASFQVSTTDATFSAAQSVGCRTVLSAGNTNGSTVFSFDDYVLLTVNTSFTTTGTKTTHTAGDKLQIYPPAIYAL